MKPPNPYVGPRPFETSDADRFFGRERAIAALSSLVQSRPASLLYSPSGAGKSSLIRAGLIAHLTKEHPNPAGPRGRPRPLMRVLTGRVTSPHPVMPGENPLLSALAESMSEHDAHATSRSLSDGKSSLLQILQPVVDPDGDGRIGPRELPVLLILDQVEQVFEGAGPNKVTRSHRTELFETLNTVIEELPNLHLLLAMREDYLAHLLPYAALLPDGLSARYRLEPLSDREAVEAVERPAAQAGVPFAPKAAQFLLSCLATLEPGGGQAPSDSLTLDAAPEFTVEPVYLQIVCTALWRSLPEGATEIDQATVVRSRVTEDALIRFIDEVVTAATIAAGGLDDGPVEARIREFLGEKLVTGGRVRAVVSEHEAAEKIGESALNALYNHYLVRRIELGRRVAFELAHDRLVAPLVNANAAWRERRPLLCKAAEDWERPGSRAAEDWTPALVAQMEAALKAEPGRYGDRERKMVASMHAWRKVHRQRFWSTWGVRASAGLILLLCGAVVFLAWRGDVAATDRLGLAAERAEEQGEPMVAWAILHDLAHRRERHATWLRVQMGAEAPPGVEAALLRLLDQALPVFEGVAADRAVSAVYVDPSGGLYTGHDDGAVVKWPAPDEETVPPSEESRAAAAVLVRDLGGERGVEALRPDRGSCEPGGAEAGATGCTRLEPDGGGAPALAAWWKEQRAAGEANDLQGPPGRSGELACREAGFSVEVRKEPCTGGATDARGGTCTTVTFTRPTDSGSRPPLRLSSPDLAELLDVTCVAPSPPAPARFWITYRAARPAPCSEQARAASESADHLVALGIEADPSGATSEPAGGPGARRIEGGREVECKALPILGAATAGMARVDLSPSVGRFSTAADGGTAIFRNPGGRWMVVGAGASPVQDGERPVRPWGALEPGTEPAKPCDGDGAGLVRQTGDHALEWVSSPDGGSVARVPLRASVTGAIASYACTRDAAAPVVHVAAGTSAGEVLRWRVRLEGWPIEEFSPRSGPAVVRTDTKAEPTDGSPPGEAAERAACAAPGAADARPRLPADLETAADGRLLRRSPADADRWIADPWGFGSSASELRASRDGQYVYPERLQGPSAGREVFRLVPLEGTSALELRPAWPLRSGQGSSGLAILCEEAQRQDERRVFASTWTSEERDRTTTVTRTWTLDPRWDYLATLAGRYPVCLSPEQRIRYLNEPLADAVDQAAACEALHPAHARVRFPSTDR